MKNIFIIFNIFFVLSSWPSFAEIQRLKLATTTSTDNSGLLGVLHPEFEKNNNIRVDVISVGTGKAIRLGMNGDVDLILVHAPEAEKKFIMGGYGIERKPVMHNDFVIIGPKSDPADIANAENIKQAMTRLVDTKHVFVSRGDNSGTHKKEKQLWDLIQKEISGDWYLSIGQGMGVVLRLADDKDAYTLTDRGTYLAYKSKLKLKVLYEGDKLLFNPYHVILVNPERHPHVKIELARKYSEFIRGRKGQNLIKNFSINDEMLFYPEVTK